MQLGAPSGSCAALDTATGRALRASAARADRSTSARQLSYQVVLRSDDDRAAASADQ